MVKSQFASVRPRSRPLLAQQGGPGGPSGLGSVDGISFSAEECSDHEVWWLLIASFLLVSSLPNQATCLAHQLKILSREVPWR